MKAQSDQNDKKDSVIDFDYIFFIAVNRLGFTYQSAKYLYFGKYIDLFEAFKRVYNFETSRMLYKIEEEKKVTSLLELAKE